MTAPPLLTIEGLSRPGLTPVDLTMCAGDIVAVAGPSGAGKSLFLRAIADLDPNDGTVVIDGHARNTMGAPAWRRLAAYLPSESGWWADTVSEHLGELDRALDAALELGLPSDVLTWRVERLSTGEKQRLALLRALQSQPKVLLLDEPTSGLDPAATAQVEAMILNTSQGGAAAIVVTHDAGQAARLSTRRLRMDGGVLHAEATP